jgi:hypothetical protein
VLRMVAGDGEADLHVCFKAAVGSEHHEGGRLEGVLRWQQDAAVVDATLWSKTHNMAISDSRGQVVGSGRNSSVSEGRPLRVCGNAATRRGFRV